MSSFAIFQAHAGKVSLTWRLLGGRVCVDVGTWSSFVILWRTGSVERRREKERRRGSERRRQNADKSVACPSRNKAGASLVV